MGLKIYFKLGTKFLQIAGAALKSLKRYEGFGLYRLKDFSAVSAICSNFFPA